VNSDRVDPGVQVASTDANGRFSKKLSPGVYEVRFEATGFAIMIYSNTPVSASAGAKFDVGVQRPVSGGTMISGNFPSSFKSTHGGFVEGTVSDPSGKPVPNVTVTFIKR
jgi:hypothetical protein